MSCPLVAGQEVHLPPQGLEKCMFLIYKCVVAWDHLARCLQPVCDNRGRQSGCPTVPTVLSMGSPWIVTAELTMWFIPCLSAMLTVSQV